ncbi:hypothetical protein DSO57_1016748 [Entomophthora muscae]|uniref:Uncharacterized protein n=1 Tax=Entomophthora muscae TaxID=34485 RepID=A0ACC2TS06_9FUNG|nr:hypothetical protein DSO57_1016748 [Entomophthora muscae]
MKECKSRSKDGSRVWFIRDKTSLSCFHPLRPSGTDQVFVPEASFSMQKKTNLGQTLLLNGLALTAKVIKEHNPTLDPFPTKCLTCDAARWWERARASGKTARVVTTADAAGEKATTGDTVSFFQNSSRHKKTGSV